MGPEMIGIIDQFFENINVVDNMQGNPARRIRPWKNVEYIYFVVNVTSKQLGVV